MKLKNAASVAASVMLCMCLAACNVKFGFVKDEASSAEDNRKSDNSQNGIFAEILDKGYAVTDSGESYTLDGDFAMKDLYELDNIDKDGWSKMSDDEKNGVSLNLLNFWAYYGDDASIRFKPSELQDGITDTLKDIKGSVLDAALEFAVPDRADIYLSIIGIENTELPTVPDDESSAADSTNDTDSSDEPDGTDDLGDSETSSDMEAES